MILKLNKRQQKHMVMFPIRAGAVLLSCCCCILVFSVIKGAVTDMR